MQHLRDKWQSVPHLAIVCFLNSSLSYLSTSNEATEVLRVPSSANLREQASRNTVTDYHLSHNITLFVLSFIYTFYLSGPIGILFASASRGTARHMDAKRASKSSPFTSSVESPCPLRVWPEVWGSADFTLSSLSISENECRIRLSFQHLQVLHGNILWSFVFVCNLYISLSCVEGQNGARHPRLPQISHSGRTAGDLPTSNPFM